MGIKKLSEYLLNQKPTLYSQIRLSQVKRLIIDGNNLSYNLYYNRPQELKNRDLYGGDYAYYTQHVRQFFDRLIKVGVEPIVLFDGATKMETPLEVRVERIRKKFSERLKDAKETVDQTIKNNEKFCSWPSASTVLFQVLRDMKIVHHQCIGKSADEIMPVVAQYFDCPVLSNDNDFLLLDIPGGVINLKLFLKSFFNITEKDADLSIELYKITNLRKKFLNFDDKMASLAFFLLSSDSSDIEMANRFITTMQSEVKSFQVSLKTSTNRQNDWFKMRVEIVFKWLSQQASFEAACEKLTQKEFRNNVKKLLEAQANRKLRDPYKKNNVLKLNRVYLFVEKMKKISLPFYASMRAKLDELPKNLEVKDFFVKMANHLFPSVPGIPDEIHRGLYEAIINPRLLDIFYNKVDAKTLMIEDFDNSTECVHLCTFDLDPFLYGLILGKNNTEDVTRIFRVGELPSQLPVAAKVALCVNTNITFQNYSETNDFTRQVWLRKLVQQACSIEMEEILLLEDKIKEINSPYPDSMLIILLSLIMCERKCSGKITQSTKWFSFFRAMFSNVVFLGHIGPDDLQTNIPKFLELKPDEKEFLQAKFDRLDQNQSRYLDLEIVHYFNCFRNCLQSINFLIQSLNLYDKFQIDRFVCGLQGTFVHNLTKRLYEESPEYFLNNILGKNKDTFVNLKNVHDNLWNFVLDSVQGDPSKRSPKKSLEDSDSEMQSPRSSKRIRSNRYDSQVINSEQNKNLFKINDSPPRSSLDEYIDYFDADEEFHQKRQVNRKANYGNKPREPNTKKKLKNWSRSKTFSR